jgi:hypothetical protein
MALVVPFYVRRPSHPLGNLSLLASQRRVPADTTGTRLWLPSDLGSKLQLWLKGDALSGANGSSIANWPDATANANDTTGAAALPTLVTSGLNGMNTVAFDGVGQYMTPPTGLLTGRTQSASFAVYKLTTDPPSSPAVGPVFGDFGTDSTTGNHNPFSDGINCTLSGSAYLQTTFRHPQQLQGLGTLGGSSALTFPAAAQLTGLGSLAGSSSLVLSPSGTATGLAALLGTSALTFAPSATATGLGRLIGSSTLVLTPSGTATGLGSLIGSSPLAFAPTGTVSGLGSLVGTAPLTLAGSGTLTGIGSLLASTALSFSLSGTSELLGRTTLLALPH